VKEETHPTLAEVMEAVVEPQTHGVQDREQAYRDFSMEAEQFSAVLLHKVVPMVVRC
jgi:hypothetical protein